MKIVTRLLTAAGLGLVVAAAGAFSYKSLENMTSQEKDAWEQTFQSHEGNEETPCKLDLNGKKPYDLIFKEQYPSEENIFDSNELPGKGRLRMRNKGYEEHQ